MRRKFVIGGTWQQFRQYCRQRDLVPERDAVFVGDVAEKLMGLELKADDIVRLGPPDPTPDIEFLVRTRIR